MKILILTGKFGMGHYSAACSLKRWLEASSPQVQVVVKDIFEYAIPEYSNTVYKAFDFIVTKGGNVYNGYYNRTNQKGPDMKPAFQSYFMKKLEELLTVTDPDEIWSTLPFCCQLVSHYKEKNNNQIRLTTCITDISSHSEWINSQTDHYLVPSASVQKALVRKGVEEAKILISGIPVRPEFDTAKYSRSGEKKQILIMGGGLGILPFQDSFYKRLNSLQDCSITMIAGKNKALYEKYHGRYDNIEVLGFTEEVYRYMASADVVISKPGGITLFETIYSETPLLVFAPYLQQEINNTGFIREHGLGIVLHREPEDCFEDIVRIMKDDLLLFSMRQNVRYLKQQYKHQAFHTAMAENGKQGKEVAVS